MSNISIVIEREYMTRVKKPSFIILTLLMPFLMLGLGLIPVLFSMLKDDSKREVVVVDQTKKYEQLIIESQLNDSTALEGYTFLPATKSLDEYRTDEESDVAAVVCITDDLSKDPTACRIYSKGEVQMELELHIGDILSSQIRRDKLAAYDIPQLDNIIHDIEKDNLSIKTIKWTEDGGESVSLSVIAMIIGMISALLIYMFVMMYGAMVMQSVMEEKTNRIVEVIVGCVKPFQLMMGKIIGVMLVGFTQILIWGIMLFALFMSLSMLCGLTGFDAAEMQQAALASQQAAQAQMATDIISNSEIAEILTAFNNMPLFETFLFFILYFLGGYILYASFYAAIGASINSQEDSSQFMMPMVIVMIIALYGAMGSIENTDGPLAFWASLFPLTSPIVMMVRIPFGVPLWQELLSIALLYGTAFFFVWAGGRIYRVGILLYGKKPTFKEMMKWITYK